MGASVKWKRWLQFRLRTLLLFTLIVALCCSAYVSIPFATFEQHGNQITVKTLYPVDSVLFDGHFHLVRYERVSKWSQWWAEVKHSGTRYCAWTEFTIEYDPDDDRYLYGPYGPFSPPECLIVSMPYFGYRYYKITHTDEGMKFTPATMPKNWRDTMGIAR
jgi:hypothetical protein